MDLINIDPISIGYRTSLDEKLKKKLGLWLALNGSN